MMKSLITVCAQQAQILGAGRMQQQPEVSLLPNTDITCHLMCAKLTIYERLSERKLLERCQRGKTQNNNESLHSIIWSLAPKQRHASLFTVEAAVAEAVMRFNAGNRRTSAAILNELSLNPTAMSNKRMAEKDERRENECARKHALADSVQGALKRRHLNSSRQFDYISGAY